MEVLGALTEYASLLVALSDGSLTEGFAKEIAETGTRLSALETTITPLVPDPLLTGHLGGLVGASELAGRAHP